MDVRVFSTKMGQNWRVTGLKAGDVPGMVAHVRVEFWLGTPDDKYGTVYYRLVPDSLDPPLARLLAKHLNEMADYTEETS
jgi:hypothetical protein